ANKKRRRFALGIGVRGGRALLAAPLQAFVAAVLTAPKLSLSAFDSLSRLQHVVEHDGLIRTALRLALLNLHHQGGLENFILLVQLVAFEIEFRDDRDIAGTGDFEMDVRRTPPTAALHRIGDRMNRLELIVAGLGRNEAGTVVELFAGRILPFDVAVP